MMRKSGELLPVADDVAISGAPCSTRVWDLGVRLFHWLLVAAVAVALVTGLTGPRSRLNVHLGAGAAIGGLIAFRVIWGFVGSTYARFSSFPIGWTAITADLAGFATGRRPRYFGHNTLGSVMVLALLSVLTLTVLTGVVALGGLDKQGPLASATLYTAGAAAENVHQALAYALLLMIVGHLLGVAYESRHDHANLVLAMVTGEKETGLAAKPAPRARARPVAAGIVLLPLLAICGYQVAALSSRPAYGVPVGPLDRTYAKECGSCHFAYPPSLAPRARWMALMDGLADHFGEDASLESGVSAAIRAYLEDNAAERWDTRAARELTLADPSDPLRLTATPYWTRTHRRIPDAIFKSRAVGTKGACDACHGDASTGRFDPQAIHIPERAVQ
jgi:cytochrome b